MAPKELKTVLYSSIESYIEQITNGMNEQYEYIKEHRKSWKKWVKLNKKERKLEKKGGTEEERKKLEAKKKKYTVKPLDCLPSKCIIPCCSVAFGGRVTNA